LLGTVHYMSPEQARGGEVDARTDIWSLGVLLFEMAAGYRPFEGPTAAHVLIAIQEGDTPALPNTAQVPSSYGSVVSKALEKDKAKRYQSASELLDAWGAISVHDGSAPVRLRKPFRIGLRRSWIAGGVAGLIVAAGIWLTVRRRPRV